MTHELAAALAQVRSWPAGNASAGVRWGAQVALEGDPQRPYRLASVTKLLSAAAVLVAAEEGTISLDDSAGPPGSTIRHLLAHASGLAPEGTGTLAPPGTRRIYSNTGFEVLSSVVEDRSGIPFARYLHEAICEPLGMEETALEGSAAHGARSTVADLLAFGAELRDPSGVLARRTIEEATTPFLPDLVGVLPGYGRQDPNPWGLGFEVRDEKSPHWTPRNASPGTYGHFGQSGTFWWVDPSVDTCLVVLTDEPFGEWAHDAWPELGRAVLSAARAEP